MDAQNKPPPKTYGLVPAETAASMSGLELLRGMIDGRFPLRDAPQAFTRAAERGVLKILLEA